MPLDKSTVSIVKSLHSRLLVLEGLSVNFDSNPDDNEEYRTENPVYEYQEQMENPNKPINLIDYFARFSVDKKLDLELMHMESDLRSRNEIWIRGLKYLNDDGDEIEPKIQLIVKPYQPPDRHLNFGINLKVSGEFQAGINAGRDKRFKWQIVNKIVPYYDLFEYLAIIHRLCLHRNNSASTREARQAWGH